MRGFAATAAADGGKLKRGGRRVVDLPRRFTRPVDVASFRAAAFRRSSTARVALCQARRTFIDAC